MWYKENIEKGDYIYEYNNDGNMINFYKIAYVSSLRGFCNTQGPIPLRFKTKISEDGRIKPDKFGRGKPQCRYYVRTEKTEQDFNILRLRHMLIDQVNNTDNVPLLKYIYGQIKAFKEKDQSKDSAIDNQGGVEDEYNPIDMASANAEPAEQ